MEFIKYHSFTNKLKFQDGIYCATEKIHGANFGYYCDGIEVKLAKRTGYIDDDAMINFYRVANSPKIHTYTTNVMKMFRLLKKSNDNIQSISVHGEMYGGIYPNIESDYSPIQRGIYYSEEHEFVAFDLMICETGQKYFENYSVACEIFEVVGLPYLKPLITGTIKDCCEYDIGGDSTLPDILGKPKLIIRNIREGHVVKRIGRHVITDGASTRSIVKIKNKKFMEINRGLAEDVTRSKKFMVRKATRKHDWKKLQSQIDIVLLDILCYVTEARMHNVMSHDGLSAIADIIDPYVTDVFKDYISDHSDVWFKLDDMAKGILKKKIKRISLPKIKLWLLTM